MTFGPSVLSETRMTCPKCQRAYSFEDMRLVIDWYEQRLREMRRLIEHMRGYHDLAAGPGCEACVP